MEKAVDSERTHKLAFPSISLDVALRMQVPSRLMRAEDGSRMNGDIGGRFRKGMVVWDTSFLLAEFLSRNDDLMQVSELKELMGESGRRWNSWKWKSGVELGAGLGLPSIVASNLGAKMIATDGDDAQLHLLSMNMQRNAPSCQVQKLFWGSAEPLTALGLKQKPDFVLAASVVYDPEWWDALLDTIKTLSGSSTLVLFAAGKRRRKLDVGPFYMALSEEFDMKLLPQSLLHPAFRRQGVIHVLKRKNYKLANTSVPVLHSGCSESLNVERPPTAPGVSEISRKPEADS